MPHEENPNEKNPNKALGELYDWLQVIVAAIVVIVLVFVFVARTIVVDGDSMNPTLYNTNRIVLSDLFYTPKYGDIVVLHSNLEGGMTIIKRVIATAGQTVDINFATGVVTVDGKALDEPYTASPTNLQEDFTGPVTVPAGCIFVMGDNRNNSTDSRNSEVGMVDSREVMGRLLFRLLPLSEFGAVNGPAS